MIPALPMGLAAAGWMTAWAATGAELHASGYYKNLLSVTDVSDNYRNLGVADRDAAIDDAQRVRLKLATSPAPGWDLLAHYEVRAAWGDSVRIRNRLAGMPAPLPVPTETAGGRVRFLDLESTFHRGSNLTLAHDLDRLQARVRAGETDITVGRQAVSWGVGLLWSPADLFAGFAPDEIDRDEKLGVDVVRIRCPVGSDWLVDMVAEPLDQDGPGRMDPDDSSLAARATTHLGEYDVSLLGGRIAGDAVVGADFSGYLRDAGFRGELVHTRVREDDERDYNRLLLSVDYGFAAAWNPYLAVEYLYNGLGAADADDYVERLGAASVQRAVSRANAFNLGRHYVGVMSSVQPTALWTLQSVTVCNVRDGSTVEYATAVRSLHENMDLVLGLHVGLGGLGTEFGGLSKEQSGVDFANADFAFAFLKWYF
jgi:hypothetical protein